MVQCEPPSSQFKPRPCQPKGSNDTGHYARHDCRSGRSHDTGYDSDQNPEHNSRYDSERTTNMFRACYRSVLQRSARDRPVSLFRLCEADRRFTLRT
jgi:hypothetical protein